MLNIMNIMLEIMNYEYVQFPQSLLMQNILGSSTQNARGTPFFRIETSSKYLQKSRTIRVVVPFQTL